MTKPQMTNRRGDAESEALMRALVLLLDFVSMAAPSSEGSQLVTLYVTIDFATLCMSVSDP